jgi:hypothetical protein
MKSASSACRHDTTAFGTTLIASLLSCFTAFAQPTLPSTQPALAQNTPQATSQPPPQVLKAWEATMSRTSPPRRGCFKSSYPSTEWQEVPCTTAPHRPYTPAPELKWVAGATGGSISQAVGSFDSVTGVMSESGPLFQTVYNKTCQILSSNVADTYSLQLNTNPFMTSLCKGSPNPDCQGWQQFLYSTSSLYNSGSAFIQYWLPHYNATCPARWNQWQPTPTRIDCWQNGPAVDVPTQTIANLSQLRLIGQADPGGADAVIMSTGDGNLYRSPNGGDILGLAQNWRAAEFNIFGDGCSSQANLSSGSSLVVRLSVNDGTTFAPDCVPLPSFTAETNNLTLNRTSFQVDERMEALPAIVFTETNAPAATLGYCARVPGDTSILASLIFRLLKR